jgi:predicted Rossmann fold nucleotide-binding protein DprA/Smf involved in DNA uptake
MLLLDGPKTCAQIARRLHRTTPSVSIALSNLRHAGKVAQFDGLRWRRTDSDLGPLFSDVKPK